MTRLGVFVTVSSLALAGPLACGGQVTVTSGGATTSSGSDTSTTTNSNPPPTTDTTTSTVPDAQCGRTHEYAVMSLHLPKKQLSCLQQGAFLAASHDFSGRVIESDESGVLLDACVPNTKCTAEIYQLKFTAPGLYNVVPVDAVVRVSFAIELPKVGKCLVSMSIVNLPTWAGLSNPITPDPIIWMAGGRGTYVPAPEAPFDVEAVPLGCYPNEPPGCRPKEDFVLRFSSPNAEPLDVPMGVSHQWVQAGFGGSHVLTVRNLRSFDTGECDNDSNWGYYIYGSEMLD